jgi:hypothetical protein
MLADLSSATVRVSYATTATTNKLRAWARRNNAVAHLAPYTRGAYSGTIRILSKWNEPSSVAQEKRLAAFAILHAAHHPSLNPA